MSVKKLFAFALAVVLSIALLTACGSEPIPSAEDKVSAPETENVTDAPQDEAAEADGTTPAELTDSSADVPEAHTIPDGWQECRFATNVNDNNWDPIGGMAEIIFAVPGDWIYNGHSTISNGNYKMMELFGSFPTDEYDVAGARYFPEGTEYPAVGINDMGREFTVLEESESEGLYDLMSHTKSIADGGTNAYYEAYQYLISRNGYSAYIFFVVNDDYDESVCRDILESAWIEEYSE